ncbi:hypothetical protein [Nocardia wallacei]|uniref:hypothetical protein n=1 Tax=Nocardia wallacei TaxID=480035 RepID=UPI0024541C90|nr:hypothetical protein [Nocardia wallacei]
MSKCPDCGQILTIDGTPSVEHIADHRLWRHPTDADRAALWDEIEASSTQIRYAIDNRDWVGAYLALGDYIDHAYRGKTYCNQLIEEQT